MKRLHVVLWMVLFAMVACKPAVRESKIMASHVDQQEKEERLRKILIGAGIVAAGTLTIIVGYKYWDTIKAAPGSVAKKIRKLLKNEGKFISHHNSTVKKQFNKTYGSKKKWAEQFGSSLEYDKNAAKHFKDYLSLNDDALQAARTGTEIDDIVEGMKYRKLSDNDLMENLKGIYSNVELKEGENLDQLLTDMVSKLDELTPDEHVKNLKNLANNIEKEQVVEAAATAAEGS